MTQHDRWILLPDSEYASAVKKADAMLKDPFTDVLAASEYGIVLRDCHGNTLSITKDFASFLPVDKGGS